MTPVMLPLAASHCQSHLRQAVERRAGRRVRDLRVEWVGETGVVLHGRADSYHAKQLAQHVVGQMSGRTVLANRIAVRPARVAPVTWPAAVFRRAERAVPAVSV